VLIKSVAQNLSYFGRHSAFTFRISCTIRVIKTVDDNAGVNTSTTNYAVIVNITFFVASYCIFFN